MRSLACAQICLPVGSVYENALYRSTIPFLSSFIQHILSLMLMVSCSIHSLHCSLPILSTLATGRKEALVVGRLGTTPGQGAAVLGELGCLGMRPNGW